MKKITAQKIAGVLTPLALVLGMATTALAEVRPETKATIKMETRQKEAVAKSSAEIDARVAALNSLRARINAMKNVSQTTRTTLSSSLDATITSLSGLKAKIAADASADIKADLLAITKGTRVYVLVIPQAHILAAADRATTIADMFTAFNTKVTARVSEATKAGHDVSAITSAQADMTAKVAHAKLQAQAAITAVSGLVADNGDAAKLEANMTALKTARIALASASDDLKAAQKDQRTIIASFKAFTKASNE